jgi:hypothetical protein
LTDAIPLLRRALAVVKAAGNGTQERIIAERLEKLEQVRGSSKEKPQ